MWHKYINPSFSFTQLLRYLPPTRAHRLISILSCLSHRTLHPDKTTNKKYNHALCIMQRGKAENDRNERTRESNARVLYNHMIRYPLCPSFLFHSLFHFHFSLLTSPSQHSKILPRAQQTLQNRLAITSYRSRSAARARPGWWGLAAALFAG